VIHDLFSRGKRTLATVEQADRWLCHPAGIPIATIRGAIREYFLSDVLGSVCIGVRNQPTLVSDVQAAFDAVCLVLSATHTARLRAVAFALATHVDPDGFALVFDPLLSEYRRVRRKERRLREQIQHDVANELVWLAVEYGCSEIVFESLAGLENSATSGVTAWSISSWARGSLLDNVAYRAELVGIEVVTVNPWGTSRHCPRCGEHGETVNAPDDHTECRHGGHFHCPTCGFEGDRDYVGAVNVGRKHFDECKMEKTTPAAYTAAGKHASFPSRTRLASADESRARSAGVQSATDSTGPVSGRQSPRSDQRVPRAERNRNDTGGLPQNHGRYTGWRCPSRSITWYVLTSTTGTSRMLLNPTGN
jgi:putative transposase